MDHTQDQVSVDYSQLGVEGNMGLVHMVAQKMRHLTLNGLMDYEDLVSEGVLGLFHALEQFDADKGFKFSTYAIRCIRFYMLRGHRNLFRELWRARDGGVSVTTFSLQANEDTEYAIGCSDRGLSALEALDRVHRKLLWVRLQERLTPGQRQAVDLTRQGLTQTEIAKRLGVTKQAVNCSLRLVIRHAKKCFYEEAA